MEQKQKLTMEEFFNSLPESLRAVINVGLLLETPSLRRVIKKEAHWFRVFLKDKKPAFELYYQLGQNRTGWVIRLFHPINKEEWEKLDTKTELKKWQKVLSQATETEICPKCFGEGKIEKFSHRNDGKCYTCKGLGVIVDEKVPD